MPNAWFAPWVKVTPIALPSSATLVRLLFTPTSRPLVICFPCSTRWLSNLVTIPVLFLPLSLGCPLTISLSTCAV